MAKIAFVYPVAESLGVQYLSAYLKARGHETALFFDPQVMQDDYIRLGRSVLPRVAARFRDRLVEDVVGYQPDIIAFSVVTDQYVWALSFAGKIKEINPRIPIIFGGIHPSSIPELVINRPEVDIVCVGEGEEAFLELIESLPDYSVKRHLPIRNLWFKDGTTVYLNELRSLNEDLDSLPFPDHDMFYRVMPVFKLQYNIISGRGCPYQCTYCCNNFLSNLYKGKGKYLRRRSVDNVIAELKLAKEKYNPPLVFFRDEVFVYNLDWVKEFGARYRKEIGIPFKCYAHSALCREELIAELKKAGCIYISMGIQSANENSRRTLLHRPETNDQIATAIQLMHKYGITVNVDHIAGIPGEGEKEMREAAEFYGRVKPDVVTYFWLTLYPGTEMIKIFENRNMITRDEVLRTLEGRGSSDFLGGNVKDNYEVFEQFRTFLSYIPLLPAFLVRLIVRKRWYRFMGMRSMFISSLLPRLLRLPFNFNADIRAWRAEIGYNIGRICFVVKRLFF